MEYMSAPQAAKKWGISERRVQILCKENRIPVLLNLIHVADTKRCGKASLMDVESLRGKKE